MGSNILENVEKGQTSSITSTLDSCLNQEIFKQQLFWRGSTNE